MALNIQVELEKIDTRVSTLEAKRTLWERFKDFLWSIR